MTMCSHVVNDAHSAPEVLRNITHMRNLNILIKLFGLDLLNTSIVACQSGGRRRPRQAVLAVAPRNTREDLWLGVKG
ncbi:hypothetical protein ACFX19_040637 [Malus domestica]